MTPVALLATTRAALSLSDGRSWVEGSRARVALLQHRLDTARARSDATADLRGPAWSESASVASSLFLSWWARSVDELVPSQGADELSAVEYVRAVKDGVRVHRDSLDALEEDFASWVSLPS